MRNKKKVIIITSILIIVLAIPLGAIYYSSSRSTSSSSSSPSISDSSSSSSSPGPWEKIYVAAIGTKKCEEVQGPTYSDNPYKGSLIDTHFHMSSIAESPVDDLAEEARESDSPVLGYDITISDMVCNLELENTKKVFAFFPVYIGMEEQHAELAKRTMKKYPDKFVPFIMPPEHDDKPDGSPTVDVSDLKDMLALEPGLFEGYGEIGLYARNGGGSPELNPDSDRLNAIYPVLKDNNLVAYFHLEVGQAESYKKVIAENPGINFIFHGDQLIRSVDNGVQNLTQIEDVISSNLNVYYTIDELYGDEFLIRPEGTKKKFLKHLENYEELLKEDLKSWKWIIEKYPNQFMWGTDRNADTIWSQDPDIGLVLTKYARAFIAGLDLAVQENFAYKNAEKLLED